MKKVIPLQTKSVASVKGTTTLNEQQLAVIQDLQGFHAINAGPGTGKSATLIARLHRIHKVYPTATVLMLVFAKSTAQELRDRVGNMSGITISTLHSLAYRVIKSSGWNFTVDISAENQESMISSLITNRTKTTVAEVVKSLNSVKGASRSTLRVRTQYLNLLKDTHKVTFDTMIIFAIKILSKHAGLRNYWQNRYDFVQLDEFQDLNPAQVELLKILVTKSGNLCVAGDQRQQIYGFRGACGAMEALSKVATVHELTLNYRCNPKILGLANSVMNEYSPLIPARNTMSIAPVFFTARDACDEAKYVVDEIERLNAQGQRYDSMAVVYRSSGVISEIINVLLDRKIPFATKSQLPNRYAQKPWREIIGLFRFMSEPTLEALREILPLFFLKRNLISDIKTTEEQKYSLLQSLPMLARKTYHHDCIVELVKAIETAAQMSPAQAMRHVVKHGLDKYFGEAMILSVESAISELEAFPTYSAFLEHVQRVKERLAQIKTIASKAKDVLTLSTIHTAKGMEFDSVFIVGLADGVLPSSQDDADISEEKRILYVGITRAKQRLYMTYPRISDNAVDDNKPCRFIAGLF